jgi:cation-transporting ATPase 13A1
MMAQAGDPSLELGDACIAAPFTFKFTSLKSVKRLIREGRKTLTTTFQMYKILSLNSLISAYTMSALYLDGVKMGDYQATYMGMGISFLFVFLSFTQPLKRLHKERPPTSIFHWSLVVSVAIQFAMHLYVLIFLSDLCEPHIDREKDDSLIPDGEFKPNLKNSVLFVYQWWLQCSVILCNYTGRPFMQDLTENRKLQYLLIANFCVLTCCVFNTSDELRETFELVEYPNDEFKQTVIRILCVDLAFCYTIGKSCKLMYLKTFETKEDDE